MSGQQKNQGCLGSSPNRWQVLSNQQTRNEALGQIKHLLREIDIQLSNKLMPLIYEIYLDAQYKERTNLHMKEIIIQLQSQIASLQNDKVVAPETPIDLFKGKKKYKKYQEPALDETILEAYQQIDVLTSTLERVEKENGQLKNELATSTMDQQTELLIESLTLQLQNEKNRNKQLQMRVMSLEGELEELERLLRQKESRIKRQREMNC